MDERHAIELLLDVGHLHIVGFQEVAAGGHIEEEVLHGHGRAVLRGNHLMGFHLGALN